MHRLSKLKNGINLITVPVKGTKATTVLAMFPVGSRYETPKLSGASHFVEHMMFKGTTKRPTAQHISRALEAVGADYNAFTYKDHTGYYVKIDGNKQAIAFDLLSDMIFNSVVDKAEVEKEKGAIVEELRMYEDNPTMAIDILADKLVFGANPLGRDIGGTEKTVRELSRAELWEFYRRHYSPNNMVLVVAGDVRQASLKKLLENFSVQKSPKDTTVPKFYKESFDKFFWPEQKFSLVDRVVAGKRKVDQAQLIISFPGLHNNHPDRFALSILLNILGGGMSSRLFVEVRERRGLAYMIKTSSASFRDNGIACVQAGLDPSRFAEAIKVIKQEFEKIMAEPVTKTELLDAQNNLAGRIALHMEDSSAQADWYAKQFLFADRMQTPDEVVKNLKKVTVAQVKKLAGELFRWDQARFAVIGPLDKEQVIESVKL